MLWAMLAPNRLEAHVAALLRDPATEVRVSAVSALEVAIKASLGKLELPGEPQAWLPQACAETGFDWLTLTHEAALRVAALPWHHRDPFDRLLVAQAMDGYTLVTHDEALRPYPVPILWT